MTYFDFNYLINKYSTTFIVEIPSAGDYDEFGDWQKGEPKRITLSGAIISHRENKIFRSEGTLTEQDRVLYTTEKLDFALKNAKVIHGNKIYSIGSMLENSAFTGVFSYSLKYVSVFGGGGA